MRNRGLLAAFCVLVVVSAAACGRGGRTGDVARPAGQAPSGAISVSQGPGGVPSANPASEGTLPSAPTEASPLTGNPDDLMTFAYATTDTAGIVDRVAAMASTSQQLTAALQAKDVAAATELATLLVAQADALETTAEQAEARIDPLNPLDDTLVEARTDALDAFGLTADYSQTATDMATALSTANLKAMASLADDAADLAGTADELNASYTALLEELQTWAVENPVQAEQALAQYT